MADGDQVSAGQTVAVVEAMKMETPVTAPATGRVQLESLEPGVALSRGQVIARVES
mgnify:FL=1